jgi:hypothetical protein
LSLLLLLSLVVFIVVCCRRRRRPDHHPEYIDKVAGKLLICWGYGYRSVTLSLPTAPTGLLKRRNENAQRHRQLSCHG